jgi:hypothetical protein
MWSERCTVRDRADFGFFPPEGGKYCLPQGKASAQELHPGDLVT